MKFGSLFAGIGGFDLGLERAGMECVWQVEIDDYCTKVLEKHWKDVKRFRNVKDVGKRNLEKVDIICGGFPCQPYSFAGKRKGAEDDRNLWPEFLRIIQEIRPDWIITENVKGIISLYLDQVLSDLEGEEYSCWTFNIPACALDAPHRRERIFVLAYTKCMERKARAKVARIFQEMSGNESVNDNADRSSKDVAYADEQGLEKWQGKQENDGKKQQTVIGEGWWTTEPNVGRVADGVPDRMDRLKGLGNAVVPQVVEWIGRRIMEEEIASSCLLAMTREKHD